MILVISGFACLFCYSSLLSFVRPGRRRDRLIVQIVDSAPGRSTSAVAMNSMFRGTVAFVATEISQPVLDAAGNGALCAYRCARASLILRRHGLGDSVGNRRGGRGHRRRARQALAAGRTGAQDRRRPRAQRADRSRQGRAERLASQVVTVIGLAICTCRSITTRLDTPDSRGAQASQARRCSSASRCSSIPTPPAPPSPPRARP